MQCPLVSIIIPTYNRAHLISETLDSVLAQTYTNWECIVVDDGSTDNTDEVLATYCKKDSRFQYHHRPKDRPKGANACRNYGFELSKGEYVNWFDSDDLMKPNFIKLKSLTLQREEKTSFVFSKTVNISNKVKSAMDEYTNNTITLENFLKGKVFWCTLDFMAKRTNLIGLSFNEKLNSGQEYNFFSVFLSKTTEGIFINKILSKRKIHSESVQQKLLKNKKVYLRNKYSVYLQTLNDLGGKNKHVNHLLKMSMSKGFELAVNRVSIPYFRILIKKVFYFKGSIKTTTYIISLLLAYLLGKGYSAMHYSRK